MQGSPSSTHGGDGGYPGRGGGDGEGGGGGGGDGGGGDGGELGGGGGGGLGGGGGGGACGVSGHRGGQSPQSVPCAQMLETAGVSLGSEE